MTVREVRAYGERGLPDLVQLERLVAAFAALSTAAAAVLVRKKKN